LTPELRTTKNRGNIRLAHDLQQPAPADLEKGKNDLGLAKQKEESELEIG